jgi:hypothetical protein
MAVWADYIPCTFLSVQYGNHPMLVKEMSDI